MTVYIIIIYSWDIIVSHMKYLPARKSRKMCGIFCSIVQQNEGITDNRVKVRRGSNVARYRSGESCELYDREACKLTLLNKKNIRYSY